MTAVQLEQFVLLARTNNMTEAAKALYISQPSLSQSISKLEKELGAALFERNGKSLRLNGMGAEVLPHAEKMLDERAAILKLCQRAPCFPSATIHVSMSSASLYFPQILKLFSAANPGIIVNLTQSGETQPRADIEIFSTPVPARAQAVQTAFYEPLSVVVPRHHALAAQSEISLAQLSQYPIMRLRRHADMRAIEDYFFEREHLQIASTMECDAPAMFRKIICQGLGLAVIPARTWQIEKNHDITILPIQGNCGRYISIRLLGAGAPAQNFYRCAVQFFGRFLPRVS